MSIGARLRELRMRKGQSLQQVADAVGLSKGHLWDMESGNSKNPSIESLQRLSDHYGVTIGTLVGEASTDGATEDVRVMFRNLQKLSPDEREIVSRLVTDLARRAKGDDKN